MDKEYDGSEPDSRYTSQDGPPQNSRLAKDLQTLLGMGGPGTVHFQRAPGPGEPVNVGGGQALVIEDVDRVFSSNWSHIGGCFYVIRTQAGIKHAVRHFLGERQHTTQTYGRPDAYPAVVALSYGYCGSTYVRLEAMHVNKMKEAIDAQ